MNSDIKNFTQGLYITFKLFQVWTSQGFYTIIQLKLLSLITLLLSFLLLLGSYFYMHVFSGLNFISFTKKLKVVLFYYFLILFGLGSIGWSAHLSHVSSPVLKLISTKINLGFILSTLNLLDLKVISLINLINFLFYIYLSLVRFYYDYQIEEIKKSLHIILDKLHHLIVGLCFLIFRVLFYFYLIKNLLKSLRLSFISLRWNFNLSINLSFTLSASLVLTHQIILLPVYPHLVINKVILFSLFCHHI